MGIFSRTRDIFAANFTELLDRAEDPARMIRMIILEMEETLVEVRASAARSIADSKEMRRALNRLEDLQGSWTEKAELALSNPIVNFGVALVGINVHRDHTARRFATARRTLSGSIPVATPWRSKNSTTVSVATLPAAPGANGQPPSPPAELSKTRIPAS